MTMNRIQKLLFSEYSDFEDMVLVESPFAQTTRDGTGLRQVQLGLTPTKLILAVDVLPPAKIENIFCPYNTDPEIESFELIAIYPVECVNLSVFRRRKRQSLKAHFVNNRVLYFELGGFEKKKMFWNLWCERVKFLCPETLESSISETSVASSSSNSSFANKKVSTYGRHIWCKYGEGNADRRFKWVDKYLFQENATGGNLSFLEVNSSTDMRDCTAENKENTDDKIVPDNKILKVNRFGNGVREGCNTALFLPADMTSDTNSTEVITLFPVLSESSKFVDLSEIAVKMWEVRGQQSIGERGRHPRKYGLSPLPHFLYGLGPWSLHPGENFTTQIKRSCSAVRVRRQPHDENMSLLIAKRLLTASISNEAFQVDKNLHISAATNKLQAPKSPIIYFWTPEYWHRPQSMCDAYSEFYEHLSQIKSNQEDAKSLRKDFKNRSAVHNYLDERELENLFISSSIREVSKDKKMKNKRSLKRRSISPVQQMRQVLKMNVVLTIWEFETTAIAYQLTMIDKELLNRIPSKELDAVIWQRSTKNVANISAFLAFSHRCSCLVSTEILREDSEKVRAQLIARYISIALKCTNINNYHSCKSVLSGLQTPAVYRLHKTWAYIREHHAVKYHTFEKLCKLYNDPRALHYQKAFQEAMQRPPFLPYVGDILVRLLDKARKVETKVPCNEFPNAEKFRALKMKQIKKLDKENDTSPKNTFHKFHKLFSVKNPDSILRNKVEDSGNRIENAKLPPEELKSASKSFEPDHAFRDNRKKRLAETTSFLHKCKSASMKYGFNDNYLATEYLLKARYSEEWANFRISFKLEPKCP